MSSEKMQISENQIREIVSRVLGITQPDRIILFGSAATRNMTRDSDIDLLIIKDMPVNQRRERVRIGDALRGLGFRVDIKVISTDWFEESKDIFGGIAYPANKYGTIIYEAA